VNRYGYNVRGLFIPYALANFFTLIIVLLGTVSYWRNGVLPERNFSNLVHAATAKPPIIHIHSRPEKINDARSFPGTARFLAWYRSLTK
jgi:hypothetical protein